MAPKKAKKKHKMVSQVLSLSSTSSATISVPLFTPQLSIHPISSDHPTTFDIDNTLQPPVSNNDKTTDANPFNIKRLSSPLLRYHVDIMEHQPSLNVMIPSSNVDALVDAPFDVLLHNTTEPGVLLPVLNTTTLVLSDTTLPVHTTGNPEPATTVSTVAALLEKKSTKRSKRIVVPKKKNRTQRALLDDPTNNHSL
jgi:hypothetical protein